MHTRNDFGGRVLQHGTGEEVVAAAALAQRIDVSFMSRMRTGPSWKKPCSARLATTQIRIDCPREDVVATCLHWKTLRLR